jgi:hypothetical protein
VTKVDIGRSGKRLFVLKPTGVWQLDLFLAAWCIGFAALASYSAGRSAGPPQAWEAVLLRPWPLGITFGAVILGALIVRTWMLRRDYRLVTDYRDYFFFDAGGQVVFCKRSALLGYRNDHEGILLEMAGTKVLVEEPADVLITVQNILRHWETIEERPQDPAHTPIWARRPPC